jgi:hypothetical protein
MGGKSGCFTVQNEVISEKLAAIEWLKSMISNLPRVFLSWRRSKGRSFIQRTCFSWTNLTRFCFNNTLPCSRFPVDSGLQAQWKWSFRWTQIRGAVLALQWWSYQSRLMSPLVTHLGAFRNTLRGWEGVVFVPYVWTGGPFPTWGKGLED